MAEITLRRATLEDSKIIFRWRNDIEARTVSRSTLEVGWEEHSSWFDERLALDHDESVWIILQDDIPVGSARIEKYADDDRAEISIVLAPDQRNRGLGQAAIKQLADIVRSMGRVPVAFVRLDNGRSMNAFRKSGFNFVDTLVELQAYGGDGRK